MQKTRLLFAAALIAALMIPTAASAGSARDRATGGGQIFATTGEDGSITPDDVSGAGDTIAFTAQQFEDGARGQIQYIDRTGGTGQDQIRGHYDVECIEVSGNTAYIQGSTKRGDKTLDKVYLLVQDNGEGAGAEADIVTVSRQAASEDDRDNEGPCDVPDDGDIALARGNAQVYDAP